MSAGYANIGAVVREAMGAWRPPPKLSLSEWADKHFYLSAESSAESGRWRTIPYQRAIMDAFTDPGVEKISVMKSARVGYTKILNAVIGYHLHQSPCPILVVQPTVDDAKGYSKEEIAPMLRDCPELAKIVFEEAEEAGPRDSGNTMLHKKFPGGVLSLVGANSGAGFRRVSRRVVLFDEVDGYPASAGADGDQIKLGTKRSDGYWDRKIGAGSTPLLAGSSRIETLFREGDQRRYYVPCPHCGHMAPFVFRNSPEVQGHEMTWPEGRPQDAFFTCQKNGCVIEHQHKREMVERGEWRASRGPTDEEKKTGRIHASFHIWAAYSYLPNASWGQLAVEFIVAKDNPETLKTFVNTVLGETWKPQGEAPDWERLFNRREQYTIGTAPAEAVLLTAGVDVQKNRFVYEVVGWAPGKESWSVDIGVLPADTSNLRDYKVLDELLSRTFPRLDGTEMAIRCLAVDSGYNTNTVYSWARQHPISRVIAVKGQETLKTILGAPSDVDVKQNGKRIARGGKVWPVGTDVAKDELYGWLNMKAPEPGESKPPGWCHFPEYGQDFFKQLTAEQLVKKTDAWGFTSYEWMLQPGRENHWLDARIYARAAAVHCGIDRLRIPGALPRALPEAPPAGSPRLAAPRRQTPGFLRGGSSGKKGWLR